jgi:hypothetical protein
MTLTCNFRYKIIYAQLQFDEIQRYASGKVEIMAQNPYLGLWVVLIIGILCNVLLAYYATFGQIAM